MAYLLDVPRCQHIKTDGVRCGSPAVRTKDFCYNHIILHEPRLPLGVPGYQLPPLECQADIQLAMRDAVQSYLDKRLTDTQARTVIYAISVVAPYACRNHSPRADLVATELPAYAVNVDAMGAPFKPSVGLSGVVHDDMTLAGAPSSPSVGEGGDLSTAEGLCTTDDLCGADTPVRETVISSTTPAPSTMEPHDQGPIDNSQSAISNPSPDPSTPPSMTNNQSPTEIPESPVSRSNNQSAMDNPKPPRSSRIYDPEGCLAHLLSADH